MVEDEEEVMAAEGEEAEEEVITAEGEEVGDGVGLTLEETFVVVFSVSSD